MIIRRRFETAVTVVIILPHDGIQNVKPVSSACKVSLTALLIMLHVFTVSFQVFNFPLEVAGIILSAIITIIIILAVLLLLGIVIMVMIAGRMMPATSKGKLKTS